MSYSQRSSPRRLGTVAKIVGISMLITLSTLPSLLGSQIDRSFDPGSGISLSDGTPGTVRCIAVQSDGKIVVGGFFHRVNGMKRNSLARLNSNGSLDESFRGELNSTNEIVHVLSLASDGKILVGGSFNGINGKPRRTLARLHTTGTLDESFNPPNLAHFFAPTVSAIAPLGVGKVLIGGQFSEQFSTPPYSLLRLNQDGTIDRTFHGSVHSQDLNGFNSPGSVNWLLPQSDGKVFVGGSFIMINASDYSGAGGKFAGGLARLFTTGSVDQSFQPAGFGVSAIPKTFGGNNYYQEKLVSSVAQQADGKLLVGRLGFLPAGPVGLDRLNGSGSIDSTFKFVLTDSSTTPSSPRSSIQSMTVQNDGRIVIGGNFKTVNGLPRHGIARVTADGSLDDFMAEHGVAGGYIQTMAAQPDGRILIGGSFTTVDNTARSSIARLHTAPVGPQLMQPSLVKDAFSVLIRTANAKTYLLQSIDSLEQTNWIARSSVTGDGAVKELKDLTVHKVQRFYRVLEQ